MAGRDENSQLHGCDGESRRLICPQHLHSYCPVRCFADPAQPQTCFLARYIANIHVDLVQTSVENAKDRGAEEPSDRTLGVTGSSLPLGAGSEDILVQDYGGLDNFRGVGALDASLSCPTSVYVVVVSLAVDKVDLKRQIKSW